MKKNYNLVLIITLLLLVMSISITFVNYKVSLETTKNQLKNQALPLSLDNIYTDIQKHIIEPYLISSMMAHDTFLVDWLKYDTKDQKKITNYLTMIKQKFKMYNIYSVFVVDSKTLTYYKQHGKNFKLKLNDNEGLWYTKFMNSDKNDEMNLSFNRYNELTLYFNFKIFDESNNIIGLTGLSLKIDYVNDILRKFRKNHGFIINFFNENADLILSELKDKQRLEKRDYLNKFKNEIISKEMNVIEYEKNNVHYILRTKYIPELDLYLVVEAKVEDFIKDAKKVFHINLLISLIISFLVLGAIISLLRKYHLKLENLANKDPLTNISNRRFFTEKTEEHLSLIQRIKNPYSLLFIDIDNFKKINDKFGHDIGDDVLIRISKLLSENIRKTDLFARWGGEEFVILFVNSDINDAFKLSNKICKIIEKDEKLKSYIDSSVTASFGLTQIQNEDKLDDILKRADKAMYQAKHSGKNQVIKI